MKLHVYQNDDKDPIKEEHDLKCLCNHVRSNRLLISGPPSCGKSNLMKNILEFQNPPFDYVQCLVADKETKEYRKGVQVIDSVDDIMDYNTLEPYEKLCVIFEDCEFKSMSKKTIATIEKLCRYGSTHCGVFVAIICQDPFSAPVNIRRKISIFYIHKANQATMSLLSRQLSISKKKFECLCEEYLKDKHDSLCICLDGHPVVLRHNVFTPINL